MDIFDDCDLVKSYIKEKATPIGRGNFRAAIVTYDNSHTGIESQNVQDALDEIINSYDKKFTKMNETLEE